MPTPFEREHGKAKEEEEKLKEKKIWKIFFDSGEFRGRKSSFSKHADLKVQNHTSSDIQEQTK
jgi:hypothetical protein